MRWLLSLPRGRALEVESGRPRLMGVVNITPDSFSDGGLYREPERAVEHALHLIAEGADLIDLGAESTRPVGGVYGAGARELSAAEELDRLIPVLTGLRRATAVPISVDTRKGQVARAALAAGADLINDVGGLADAELGHSVAEAGCPLVLMHSRGRLGTMQLGIDFRDLLGEIRRELADGIERTLALGVRAEQLILDPGIGFGKTGQQNLTLLSHLDALATLGRPLLVGASRKSFIGELTGAAPRERVPGSLAAAGWAALGGAALLRVHDVAASAQFLRVWQAAAEASA